MPSLTGANAIIMLTINPLFTSPVQLQGFAADDIFDTNSIEGTETSMGVDGILSGGFVNVPVEQGYSLQSDSASIFYFDQWYYQQKAIGDTLTANGVITLPSLGKKWTMTKGFLVGYMPIPAIKKLAQPQKFTIRWQSMVPNPT